MTQPESIQNKSNIVISIVLETRQALVRDGSQFIGITSLVKYELMFLER